MNSTVRTNDIKKGMLLQLRNGWGATMMDNKKGNSRLAEVRGTYTEMGSVYAWDIMRASSNGGLNWHNVELTEAQVKQMTMVKRMGF